MSMPVSSKDKDLQSMPYVAAICFSQSSQAWFWAFVCPLLSNSLFTSWLGSFWKKLLLHTYWFKYKKKSYLIDKMIKGEDARDNLQKYTKYQLPVTCTSLLKNENSTHLTSTQYVLLSDFYFEVLQNIHYLLFDLLSVFYIKTVIYSYSGANLQIK